MDKYISDIDTNRFGFKIAKVNDFQEPPVELINKLKQADTKLIISRIKASNIELINSLEKIGFELKDFQLTHNFNLDKENFPFKKETYQYTLRDFKPDDIEQISVLARNAFKNYGHYFADKRLNYDKCMEIYGDWAKNSCLNTNVADKIIVAEMDKEILGFLSFKIINNSEHKYAMGGLGAVSSEHRKLGVFRGINIEGLRWGIEEKLARIEHNVLATNFPVNSTYTKLGFKIINSEITLHCWLDN